MCNVFEIQCGLPPRCLAQTDRHAPTNQKHTSTMNANMHTNLKENTLCMMHLYKMYDVFEIEDAVFLHIVSAKTDRHTITHKKTANMLCHKENTHARLYTHAHTHARTHA